MEPTGQIKRVVELSFSNELKNILLWYKKNKKTEDYNWF
jgi:hypothetical protein